MVRALGLMSMLWAATSWAAPLVVIDPGHGGTQAGASSPDGLVEKNISLALARRVKGALERELKATVVLTREQDSLVLLPERVTLANRRKPDAFVSIHANSMPTQRQRLLHEGIETYFLSAAASGEEARKVAARENAEAGGQPKGVGGDTLSFILADLQRAETHADSSRLAYAVQEALIAQTGAVDRGVQQAPFYVLMGLDAPAVLIEVGFISHPDESKRLSDPAYQERLARAIAAGLTKFLREVGARDGHQGG